MKNKKYIILVVLFFAAINFVNAKSDGGSDAQEVLHSIVKGMLQNSISSFSSYLSDNCYISLNNGTIGYYTTSQSYYIFENYFSQYKVTDIKFNEIKKSTLSYNASGIVKYNFNGSKYECRIFVSLKTSSGLWYISQIMIN